ncbi:MAG: hypothetical protein HZC40_08880 [Chloroflexi bacterium]|nr:hypothetical protein [Chloroflexota bacterium]
MPQVEIWKSRTDLRTKSLDEQDKIFDSAAQLIKAMVDNEHRDREPYRIEKAWGNLLIWTADGNPERLNPRACNRLREFFEPLTFVSFHGEHRERTAEALARKLA